MDPTDHTALEDMEGAPSMEAGALVEASGEAGGEETEEASEVEEASEASGATVVVLPSTARGVGHTKRQIPNE